MGNSVKIEWDSSKAERYFAELLRRGSDTEQLMADIGESMVESTQRRFAESIAPDGTPWAPVSRGGLPLVLSGTLRDEVNAESGPNFVEIFSSRPYGIHHQFGTQRNSQQAIIPRPFLGISLEDQAAIEGLAIGYLDLE